MMLKGIPISEGYAVCRIYKIIEPRITVQKKHVSDIEAEFKAYEDAIAKTIKDLEKLIKDTENKYGSETAKIFEAHMMIADDIEIKKEVKHVILAESCNFAYALDKVVSRYALIFANMEDLYLKERAKDLLDVAQSMIHHANKQEPFDFSKIEEKVIIAIKDLTPSQTALINPNHVVGILTEAGGKTSHSAIIARMMGIPAIAGIPQLMDKVKDGQEVIMDGYLGHLYLDYSKELKSDVESKLRLISKKVKALREYVGRKTLSKDFERYHLYANMGSSRDLEFALSNDAEGVGLFRTELLFLDQTLCPSMEFQTEEYEKVLKAMAPKEVIIRTLDIGGDKQLPYIHLKKEDNPFLGNRGIRLSLHHKELFRLQLKALIQADTENNLKIMFPMISTIEEWLEAKSEVLSVQKELQNDKNIPLGMMVEVPSAALMAEQFAKHVDFFSIGTNDLTQYTMAADRTNQDINSLFQPFNPAVLQLIHHVAQAGLKHKIPVAVCGELASDPYAIPLLLGLGVTELSMNPSQILKSRRLIAQYEHKFLRNIALDVLKMETENEVITYLKKHIKVEDFHG